MARSIQLRRGTKSEHETFIGKTGEITVDTTNNTLVVHDNEKPGGYELARADLSNTNSNFASTQDLNALRNEIQEIKNELESGTNSAADYIIDYYPRESDMATWDGYTKWEIRKSGHKQVKSFVSAASYGGTITYPVAFTTRVSNLSLTPTTNGIPAAGATSVSVNPQINNSLTSFTVYPKSGTGNQTNFIGWFSAEGK